jgi:hypothetical protein
MDGYEMQPVEKRAWSAHRAGPQSQSSRRLDQSRPFQLPKDVVQGIWRVPALIRDLLQARVYDAVVEAHEVEDELVRRLRLDIPLGQEVGRKVLEIVGDDGLGPALIAAARTWRSPPSGSLRPSISGS